MKPPIETFEDLIACEDVGIILQPRFRYRQADFGTIVLYSSLCYFRKTRSLFVRKAKSGTLKTLGDAGAQLSGTVVYRSVENQRPFAYWAFRFSHRK